MPFAPVLPNRIYPLGCSDHAHAVFVTAVNSACVTFHHLRHDATAETIPLDAFRVLCRAGMKEYLLRSAGWDKKHTDCPKPEWLARHDHYERWIAGENTMPALAAADYSPEQYEPLVVEVRANRDRFPTGQGKASDPWYVAETYGGVMGLSEDNSRLSIHIPRKNFAALQADARFSIITARSEVTGQNIGMPDSLPEQESPPRPSTFAKRALWPAPRVKKATASTKRAAAAPDLPHTTNRRRPKTATR